ncbi:hypothetical protein NFI96_002893 [Prochilodus magdalenae]|nr:hypothetical protein NFI96_002893 [Prochilodus magdalenae]
MAPLLCGSTGTKERTTRVSRSVKVLLEKPPGAQNTGPCLQYSRAANSGSEFGFQMCRSRGGLLRWRTQPCAEGSSENTCVECGGERGEGNWGEKAFTAGLGKPLHAWPALKRSFDIDDVDEIPTFSPTSSVTSPISPSSILGKTSEVRSAGNHMSPTYRSRISLSSSPAQSPAMKNRMVSSLSFNRGTMGKPTIHSNTGINRAASFQNKFNPNGFNSCSGPGSDNDSLHSSSSSLEYQASSKLSSYTSPPQSPMGVGEYKAQRLGSPALKKFSSHGNMFHSELEGPLVIPTEPLGISHGSMPSLDLQMAESGGMRQAVSPGTRFPNAPVTWNAHRLHNNSMAGKDSSINHQPLKTKEPARLNKFPLDLDHLVAKPPPQEGPVAPRPPPRFHPVSTSPTVSASPSASVSSLDSTDLPVGPNYTAEKREATTPPGAIPVPNISESPVLLSPAQTPRFNLVSQPQVVQIAPATSPPPTQVNIISSTSRSESPAKESVGSILQRIASFSRVEAKVPMPSPSPITPLSNGVKRESPAVQHRRSEVLRGAAVCRWCCSNRMTHGGHHCSLEVCNGGVGSVSDNSAGRPVITAYPAQGSLAAVAEQDPARGAQQPAGHERKRIELARQRSVQNYSSGGIAASPGSGHLGLQKAADESKMHEQRAASRNPDMMRRLGSGKEPKLELMKARMSQLEAARSAFHEVQQQPDELLAQFSCFLAGTVLPQFDCTMTNSSPSNPSPDLTHFWQSIEDHVSPAGAKEAKSRHRVCLRLEQEAKLAFLDLLLVYMRQHERPPTPTRDKLGATELWPTPGRYGQCQHLRDDQLKGMNTSSGSLVKG